MNAIAEEVNEYELQRGKPMPSKNHGLIQAKLIFLLTLNYREKYTVISEVSLALPEGERVPDLAIFPIIEFTPTDDEVRMTELPFCVIEILSPTQTVTELVSKAKEYFAAGVKTYWFVNPILESIHVFTDAQTHVHFGKSEILRDENLQVELNLSEVFAKR